jgi:hypothetical protein
MTYTKQLAQQCIRSYLDRQITHQSHKYHDIYAAMGHNFTVDYINTTYESHKHQSPLKSKFHTKFTHTHTHTHTHNSSLTSINKIYLTIVIKSNLVLFRLSKFIPLNPKIIFKILIFHIEFF